MLAERDGRQSVNKSIADVLCETLEEREPNDEGKARGASRVFPGPFDFASSLMVFRLRIPLSGNSRPPLAGVLLVETEEFWFARYLLA